MADENFIELEKIIGQEIPSELLEQIKVLGRVQFQPKPTTASAISTSAQTEDPRPEADDLDSLIDSVVDMEDMVEELEDMADQLLKDMSIPPVSDRVAEAACRINPSDCPNITKKTLDNAIATMDYFPILMLGQDPVLAALTGDGRLDGPYLKCSQVTRDLAKLFEKTSRKNLDNPEVPIKDSALDAIDRHEDQKAKMIAEIILQMLWNIIWVKATVDMAIINPLRVLIARPVDILITFFKKIEANKSPVTGKPFLKKNRFKKSTTSQLEYGGPVNRLLNKARLKLLCVPKLFWNGYSPPLDPITKQPINCFKVLDCPPKLVGKEFDEEAEKLSEMKGIVDDLFPENDDCIKMSDFSGNFKQAFQPTGLGIPPECAQAAKTVIDAVLSDALSPTDPTTKGDPSKTFAVAEQLKSQLEQLEEI